MDDKKDIGKAFKDKLEELQVSPQDLVWDNIVTDLDKKEKKRRIIPIWFKVAGIAVVLFTIGGLLLLSKENRNTNDVVTVDEHNNATNKLDSLKIKLDTNSTPLVLTDMEKLPIEKDKNNNITQTSSIKNKSKNYVAHKNNIKNQISINNLNKSNNKQYQKDIFTTNNLEQKQKSITNSINNNTFKKSKQLLKFTFAELPLLASKLDMSLVNSENNSEIKRRKKALKIAINGTPIFYSTISNGSSINKIFDGNGKTSDITSSYGLQTSLQISNKISFRTGINKVDLAYNTQKATEKTVINSQTINLVSSKNSNGYETFQDSSFGNIFELKQEVNYIEIPLEFSYKLIKRKIEIDVITGLSTLILNDNSIIVKDKTIGKANNLNKLSYTGNLGLGFNYKLTEHLNLSIEPIYKLQFNTYSSSVNFNPYYFGVYSGFSYKF